MLLAHLTNDSKGEAELLREVTKAEGNYGPSAVNQINHILHIQMRVPLHTSNIPMSAHHHDLKLVQTHPCDLSDARVPQLMKPHIVTQPDHFSSPSYGLCDAVRSHRENRSPYPQSRSERSLGAPQRA